MQKNKGFFANIYLTHTLQDNLLILADGSAIIYSIFLCDVFGALGGSAHDIEL